MRVVRYTYAAAHELFPGKAEYTDLRIEAVRNVLLKGKFAEGPELNRELRDPNACLAVAWVEHEAVAACVFRMPPPKKERERAARCRVLHVVALRVAHGNQNKGVGTAIVKALQHAAAVHQDLGQGGGLGGELVAARQARLRAVRRGPGCRHALADGPDARGAERRRRADGPELSGGA